MGCPTSKCFTCIKWFHPHSIPVKSVPWPPFSHVRKLRHGEVHKYRGAHHWQVAGPIRAGGLASNHRTSLHFAGSMRRNSLHLSSFSPEELDRILSQPVPTLMLSLIRVLALLPPPLTWGQKLSLQSSFATPQAASVSTRHRTRLRPHHWWQLLNMFDKALWSFKKEQIGRRCFLPSFIRELGYIRRPTSVSAGAVTSLGFQKSLAPSWCWVLFQGKCRQKHCWRMILLKILFIS